jgi:hypothetical protein
MADITKIDRFSHKAGDGTELWLFTGLDVNGVAARKRPELEAQLQATSMSFRRIPGTLFPPGLKTVELVGGSYLCSGWRD